MLLLELLPRPHRALGVVLAGTGDLTPAHTLALARVEAFARGLPHAAALAGGTAVFQQRGAHLCFGHGAPDFFAENAWRAEPVCACSTPVALGAPHALLARVDTLRFSHYEAPGAMFDGAGVQVPPLDIEARLGVRHLAGLRELEIEGALDGETQAALWAWLGLDARKGRIRRLKFVGCPEALLVFAQEIADARLVPIIEWFR
jgi:hypothetical protein